MAWTATAAARRHVEEIRRTKFSINGEPNPLTEDLHHAVKNLSAELYAKDVHFLMELIQNAEDNEYPEGVDPSLEFVITSKDITNTGAPATLLVFNNEKGFSDKNIESICSVGRSTKKGFRTRGYIGEKGIGFKSVFLITSQPYIFSNGYQIKFNEKPCEHCKIGYIVPESVEENQIVSAIESIYGLATPLPTTTLVLPLRPEKVKPVKEQLSSIHPEVLLFLSKIKQLSVREDNEDPKDKISAISISSERNFVTSKSMDAVSYTVHLTAGDGIDKECGYYMWKQRFPVKPENKVDVRTEVDEWVITLAFPHGERLKRGSTLPGIYSFLPTETVTNFPFIIQADFLMASSREDILWDNTWNHGILDCVPDAFINAFTSLLKSIENAPVSSLPNMFQFLPIKCPSHKKLMEVHDTIKEKLMNETIVPCESYTGEKLFCKPNEVSMVKPSFWRILNKAWSQGVSLSDIPPDKAYLLAPSFDNWEYNAILDYLKITHVNCDWYERRISSPNFVMRLSEDVYIELLLFIEYNFYYAMKNTPIIKYVGLDGNVGLFKIDQVSHANKLLAVNSANSDYILWLTNWSTQFQHATGQFFLPKATQEAIQSCKKKSTIMNWLTERAKVTFVSVSEYAELVCSSLNYDRKSAVTYAHFLHKSLQKKYLYESLVRDLCSRMPIVDNYGQVTTSYSKVLVPANGSKWVELIGSNPWRQHNYIELGEDYTRSMTFFGEVTSGKELFSFLKIYAKVSDVPHISPPDAIIPNLSSPLSKTNTFLLLDWIRNLRNIGVLPKRFLSSIKNGSWLKITLGGVCGYRAPSQSFMLKSSIGNLLHNGSVLGDISLVDEQFYGEEIKNYRDELRTIGVGFENADACQFIGMRLISLAASSNLTRDHVLSILKFIRYLETNYISSVEFITSIKGEWWLRTSQGVMTPTNSVLFSQEWSAAKQISDIPFIDEEYYGEEVLSFTKELALLGVVANFNYQLVLDNLKSSSSLTSLSSEALLLILNCIQNLRSSDKLVQAIKNNKCLKTNLGYRYPSECFLLNPESEWGCLLHVFASFPILDEHFYGSSIFSMANELKKIGVMVNLEDASKVFTLSFKEQASLNSIKKEHVLSFLECYRKLRKLNIKFPSELTKCVCDEKWLRTRLGDYRLPKECILFGTDWEPISSISLLPFIDDSNEFYGDGIHEYHEELNELGVVTDFKDGAKFVADGFFLPQHCSILTPVNVYALLDSVKRLKETESDIPPTFLEKLSQKNWLKTYFGYKCPNECMLFDPARDSLLKRNDGPFIHEGFYGPAIGAYKDELNLLGVITDVNNGCQMVATYIGCHSDFETNSRIYKYLYKCKWEPVDEVNTRIWIPKGIDNGEWVMPRDCVLHDENNLFGEHLNVLENRKYDNEILDLFANTLKVKVHPSVEDYCKLWKTWESSGRQITHDECGAFWEFVAQNWNPTTEVTFNNNLLKLPVLDPTSNGILLSDKRDVFIGDDLFLTDLFQSCCRPIFVWFPQSSLKSDLTLTMLVDIYTKLGVRTLSESAQKNISDINAAGFEPVNSKEKIIKKGLVKLILGFLADPNLKIEANKRHEAVSRLLAIEAFETSEKMSVRYSLSFSCGDPVDVEPRRMIRWDKQQSKLFMQKLEKTCSHENAMEYAFHFAEEIAEGVLWENEELVPDLSELIRSGYFVEFEDEAVDFLMKMKNLRIYLEDREYLSSKFSSSKDNLQVVWASPSPSPGRKRRRGHNSVTSSPSYELRSTKSRK